MPLVVRSLMAYYRVHTVKKNRYLYRHESYRIGKKVKKRSTYIGPLAGITFALKAGIELAANKKTQSMLFKSDKQIMAEAAQRFQARLAGKEEALSESASVQQHSSSADSTEGEE